MTREGMTVMPARLCFASNGLSTVWRMRPCPRAKRRLLRPGAPVEGRSAALPGPTFTGNVQAILTRRGCRYAHDRARIELANPSQALRPACRQLGARVDGVDVLAVPTEAVIRTGTRHGRDRRGRGKAGFIRVGRASRRGSRRRYRDRRGSCRRPEVVVSGQFLIDSEASLRAAGHSHGGGARPAREHDAGARRRRKITATADGKVTLAARTDRVDRVGAMSMQFILRAMSRGPTDARSGSAFSRSRWATTATRGSHGSSPRGPAR